jgi:hypothetical protein
MIVRVMGEGQYRIESGLFDALNAIDNRIVEHVQKGDRPAFEQDLAALIAEVKRCGQPIADTELVESDIIVPPADMSLDEARDVFKGAGLFEG